MYEEYADFHGEDAIVITLLGRVVSYLEAEWCIDWQKVEKKTVQKVMKTVDEMKDKSVPAISGHIAMTILQLKHWS